MEGVKKEKSISNIFARYILAFCITNALLIISIIFLSAVALNMGIIRQANYFEREIERNIDKISKAESVANLIPQECQFAVYDFYGNVSETNIS